MLGAGSQALVLALVLEGAVLVVCLGGDVHVVMNEQTHTANSVDSHPSTVPVTTLHISCSTSDHHFGFCDSQLSDPRNASSTPCQGM